MHALKLAPHRLYFFAGTLALLLLFGWWWLTLARPAGLAAVPIHALLMPLGLFPLFILGFTFTAGPRWLGVNGVGGFLPIGSGYLSGLVLVVLGAISAWRPLVAWGFGLMCLAWLAASWRWSRLVKASKAQDRYHAKVLLAAMLGGALAQAAAMMWAAGIEPAWIVARQFAFFGFLLPIFLAVCHRMLPFFSGNVIQPYTPWRPYGLLWAWLGGCISVGVAGGLGWSWLEAIAATAMSLGFAYTSWRWGVLRSLGNRLLAMLHLSFAWLAITFALMALGAAGVLTVGSAPIHALGLGFMATMLVGFVSRVTFGHSGRPLQAENWLWALYLGLHLAAASRVAASLLAIPWLMHASASLWLALLALWVMKMAPIYLKPRIDGQPG